MAPTFVPDDPLQPGGVKWLQSCLRGEDWRGLPGKRLGRYWLVRELGRGGLGAVYQAEAMDGSGPVAVRVLAPRLLDRPGPIRELRARLEGSSSVTSSCVARHLELPVADGVPFLVSEYVPGVSLAALLARYGRLSAQDGWILAGRLAAGLAALHAAGWVHGDIRPGCVLGCVPGDGTRAPSFEAARLADHGLAPLLPSGDVKQQSPKSFGSGLLQESREARGTSVDSLLRRADIAALGTTLQRAWLGRVAVAPESTRHSSAAGRQFEETARRLEQLGLAPPIARMIARTQAGENGDGVTAAELADEVQRTSLAAGFGAAGETDRNQGALRWQRLWAWFWPRGIGRSRSAQSVAGHKRGPE